MAGFTLDAGALIAVERNDRRVANFLRMANSARLGIAIPTGVIGQAWRGGARQARLARLLRSADVEIVVLDELVGRAAGQLCGARNRKDVIDATVVLCAREREHTVLTSDPDDIRALDETLNVVVV